jgi:hypothetical protein
MKDVQIFLEGLDKTLSEYSRYHYSPDRAGPQFESPEKTRPLKDDQILDAFIHTLLLSRISSRERLTKHDLDEILSMNPLTTFSQSKQSVRLDKICRHLKKVRKEEGSSSPRMAVWVLRLNPPKKET